VELNTIFVNKMANAVGLLVMTMCIVAPFVSAADYSQFMAPIASATDYSQLENNAKIVLSNPDYNNSRIVSPDVEISPYRVYINYSGTKTILMDDLGAMIGVYWSIVDKYPEVGDLLITIDDMNSNAVATFDCKKILVKGHNIKDVNATMILGLKVLETLKESEATPYVMDRSAYTQMENEVKALLKSPNYSILDPHVSIGPSCVIINYDNNGILQVSLDRDLNYVIDQYVSIVKRFPEITGPLMIERSGGAFGQNEFFEYRCKREWVDSTNTTDINSIDDLRLEVRLTEKTKPMTEAETRRYIG
jgi:hypothetical protein